MPLASLQHGMQGSVVYAEVHGDVDMSNAADLRLELSRMTPNDARGLIVDLRDVSYLDSAGIRLLYHLREDLRAGRQKLRLVIADEIQPRGLQALTTIAHAPSLPGPGR